MNTAKRIGILGGTFDPVHNAHLAIAQNAFTHFELDTLKFIPCAITPHRNQPRRTAQQRCDMVKLAINQHKGFELDTRECQRDGYSYTIDTLFSLKEELGEQATLFFILGTDAFEKIQSWHRYEDILTLCHLVVMQRPGYRIENPDLQQWTEKHVSQSLQDSRLKACGSIFFHEGPLMDISATKIRHYLDFNMPNAANNIKLLSQEIPEAVKHYIHQHGLYQERQY